MADKILHLLLVAEGGYTPSVTTDSTEIWVNTLRMRVAVDGPPAPVGPLEAEFDVVSAALTDSGSGWSGASDWRLEGGVTDFDPLSYLVDQAMPAYFSWQAASFVSSHCELRSLKLYPIGTDGLAIPVSGFGTASPAFINFDEGSRPGGGGSSSLLPLQMAMCVSHYTPARGRHFRGRMFRAGLTTAAVASDGHFASGVPADGLARQVSLMNELTIESGGVGGLNVNPIIAPKIGGSYSSFAFISEVRVGDIPDTQRRRRNRLVETYVSDVV